MKVTAEIGVMPKEYFKHLCDITIKDIKKSTNKEVSLKDLLDGYHYEKIVPFKKREAIISMSVGPLIKDKYFIMEYETKDTKCLYYYDFSSKDGKNYVTYSEENNYKKDTIGNKLGALKRKFDEKALKRRIFNNIELTTTYIKNHREEK